MNIEPLLHKLRRRLSGMNLRGCQQAFKFSCPCWPGEPLARSPGQLGLGKGCHACGATALASRVGVCQVLSPPAQHLEV